jgi:uncharacterized glyoxalase superfamily protein PhnB
MIDGQLNLRRVRDNLVHASLTAAGCDLHSNDSWRHRKTKPSTESIANVSHECAQR